MRIRKEREAEKEQRQQEEKELRKKISRENNVEKKMF